jgi:hypothetical protein
MEAQEPRYRSKVNEKRARCYESGMNGDVPLKAFIAWRKLFLFALHASLRLRFMGLNRSRH